MRHWKFYLMGCAALCLINGRVYADVPTVGPGYYVEAHVTGLESKVDSFFAPQKAKAEMVVDVPTSLSKSASQAVYEAINNQIKVEYPGDIGCYDFSCLQELYPDEFNDPNNFENPDDPNTFIPLLSSLGIYPDSECFDSSNSNCALNEIDFMINISGGPGGFSSGLNSYWPENIEDIDPVCSDPEDPNCFLNQELVKNYNITINGNNHTFPLTHYIKDNTGKLIFSSVVLHGGLSDYCVLIDKTATGVYAFVGSIVEDANDLKDSNGANLIEQEYLTHPTILAMANKDSIHADLLGGAELIIGGCFFNEGYTENSVYLENIVNYVDIKRNIFKNSGTGIFIKGNGTLEAMAENGDPPILNIVHNDFDRAGIGINFSEYLDNTIGTVANNSFTDCGLGIANYLNSGVVDINSNNFYECETDYTAGSGEISMAGSGEISMASSSEPINNHSVAPGYLSDYTLEPISQMIDLGIDVGMSYKGNAPDLGVYEGANCSRVDLYPIGNPDGKRNLRDFAVFAQHWLECDDIALPPLSEGNFNSDSCIDYKDLAWFGPCWLEGE